MSAGWVILVVLMLVGAVAAFFAGWTQVMLQWSYAKGERAGYDRKF